MQTKTYFGVTRKLFGNEIELRLIDLSDSVCPQAVPKVRLNICVLLKSKFAHVVKFVTVIIEEIGTGLCQSVARTLIAMNQ